MNRVNDDGATDKVYYIQFKEISDPLIEDQIEKEISILFKDIMTKEECYNNVVFGNDENSLFLFMDIDIVSKIINFSKTMGFFKFMKEISEDILIRTFNDKYISVIPYDDNFKNTFFNTNEFTHILENFISDNLTKDLVLDKINNNGIESLSEKDFFILESENDIKIKKSIPNLLGIDFNYN
tara:strand:+ start:2813 stop:3358 length:546 start_codon:yes stop_codon:yes gene_type:complete